MFLLFRFWFIHPTSRSWCWSASLWRLCSTPSTGLTFTSPFCLQVRSIFFVSLSFYRLGNFENVLDLVQQLTVPYHWISVYIISGAHLWKSSGVAPVFANQGGDFGFYTCIAFVLSFLKICLGGRFYVIPPLHLHTPVYTCAKPTLSFC